MRYPQKQAQKNWVLRKRFTAIFLLAWIMIAFVSFAIMITFAKNPPVL